MRNALKSNNHKFILMGKIKGLAGEAKRARTSLHKVKSERAMSDLQERKLIVSTDIRHHLLAYAFLRGLAYRSVERDCDQSHKPNSDLVFKIVSEHAPTYIPYDPVTGTGGGSYHVNPEMVKRWLAGEE